MVNPTTYQPTDEKLRIDLVNKICAQSVLMKIYIGKRFIESFTREISSSQKIFISYTPEPNELPFATKLEAECHFSINQDMYFFKGNPTYADNTLIFSAPTIIYKIQRRENFRVYIPPSVQQSVEIATERGAVVHMNNISLTGAQIKIKSSNLNLAADRFKLNDYIKIKLTLLDFNNQNFNCVIKFAETKNGFTTLGIQFQNLDASKTQDLQNIIAKLDRLNRQLAA